MRLLACVALAAFPLAAHVISMSTGDLVIRGASGRYEARIPLYEVIHMKDAERAIWSHIRFRTAGADARLTSKSCRENAAAYLCTADLEFAAPVERLEVECTFHAILVRNHVHLLRAEREGKRDQALFDATYSTATLRFQPPGEMERILAEMGGGIQRAAAGWVQLLFLVCLVLAARSARELAALAAAFVAGQVAGAIAAQAFGWQPSARFVEAATALTLAYLAIEILLLPGAGARWAVAGVLGGFHGLAVAIFLQAGDYRAAPVLAGAAAAQLALLALLGLALRRLAPVARALHAVRLSAAALFAAGIVWFLIRLRS